LKVEILAAPVQVRRIRRCTKLPRIPLLGLVLVMMPVRPVLISLGGIGTALLPGQQKVKSSIWIMRILMTTPLRRRSRRKF